jgi:peptidoglycan L-alanyl-D-glutamate endopeptidase CwlK
MNLQENIRRIKEMMELNDDSTCVHCDERTKKNIETLVPELQSKAKTFIDRVKKETGKNLTIVMGIRTPEEQDRLYCKGKPKDKYCLSKKLPTQGNIVTYKKGGESNHNFGKAFDVYFNENGVVNVKKEITSDVVNIGKQLGLEWGGDFRNFHDDPHFQLPGASKI